MQKEEISEKLYLEIALLINIEMYEEHIISYNTFQKVEDKLLKKRERLDNGS